MKGKNYTINQRLFDAYLDRMNFLNEVTHHHPQAISFGPGDPDQKYFDVKEIFSCFREFASRQGTDTERGTGEDEFYDELGQYNRTGGIISDTIAKLLAHDENICMDPSNLLVCNGAQEGMMIIINTLFENENDVLLVSDPSYIGFVGYAKIYGVPIYPVRRSGDSIDFDHLEEVIGTLKKAGKNPKALYEVVDFHNPTGSYMPLQQRELLLSLALKHDFLIVEDNPYSYFIYEGEKIPTLKALDQHQRVIYLCSFSKTLFPAMRLAFIAAEQEVLCGNNKIRLVDAFKRTKSFTSVNTSTLLQSLAGSYLQQQGYSLKNACRKKKEALREKRDVLLDALDIHFGSPGNRFQVQWTAPRGGFFLPLQLPFEVTGDVLQECVEDYGVIFCPMSFFSIPGDAPDCRVRLSFSNLSPRSTVAGIEKLALFVTSRLEKKSKPLRSR